MPKTIINETNVENISETKAKLEEILKKTQEENNKLKEMLNEEDIYIQEYPEPAPNKNIKIISLYYGVLNLFSETGVKLSFNHYGQVKNILYNKLIDVINSNLKFAENGYFYILDKDAVYHLGLTDAYKKIQPKEVIDNLYDYDETVINQIAKKLTDEQKFSLLYGIAERIFHGEKLDLNKISVLSKALNKDINDLVKEMQSVEKMNKDAQQQER